MLNSALPIHNKNKKEIDYLYRYYTGRQKILNRTKPIRPEICNKVVVNRAAEIVDFKTGYLLGEPMQYVARHAGEEIARKITQLNTYMQDADKATFDSDLAFWFTVCGTAFRLVLPGKKDEGNVFRLSTVDPRRAFVVYSNDWECNPLVAFICQKERDGDVFTAYTNKWHFVIKKGEIVSKQQHTLGGIPIVEYPSNIARIGAFEQVITLLDAINAVESNRMDGVEQFIQAIMVFENCEMDSEKLDELRAKGAIGVKGDPGQPAKVYYLNEQLDQTQTQVLIENLYHEVLTIVGMPAQGGESNSTSDTGSAVIMRNGWQLAEARAKQTELMFKRSERRFLKLALHICRTYDVLDLQTSDVEQKFTRRNYADILTKSQVLTTMLNNDKVAPEDAYAASGMFTDSMAAYQRGMAWFKSRPAEEGNEGN